jgi:hypothetical protein
MIYAVLKARKAYRFARGTARRATRPARRRGRRRSAW